MAEALGIKMCGLMRPQDALAADRFGADFLGVVVSAGFSRSVAPARAKAILEGTTARKVAVVVDEGSAGSEAAARTLEADVIQLHGSESPEVLEELRRRGPWTLWKSVRAKSLEDVAEAVGRYGELADGILIEGWKDGVLGGGGARLALDGGRVRELVPGEVDLVLAGGLRADNVAEAVRNFRPDVVDVSSGVERVPGEKDHDLMRDFIDAARDAAEKEAGAPAEEMR